ncbi:hypothetical protein B0H13DRAFT_2404470 [Mycena leptocephala]|nr:hypothetical protein B0H13DRAFT_2404470 [Mycena leptocephala]
MRSLIQLCLTGLACAALTNHTIDDTAPVVVYSGKPVFCSSDLERNFTCAGYENLVNGTIALDSVGNIEIPFTGSAVYVFVGNRPATAMVFHIDGDLVGGFDSSTHPNPVSTLAYYNASVPNGTHVFLVIPPEGLAIDFDALIYSLDDETLPSASPSLTLPSSKPSIEQTSTTFSQSANPISTPASSRKNLRAAAISSGVLGLLVFVTIVGVIIRCRARRRNSVAPVNFLVDEVPNPAASLTTSRKTSAHQAEPHSNLLVEMVPAHYRPSETVSVAPNANESDAVARALATMKCEQTQAVHNYVSATQAFADTERGLPPLYVE